MASSHEIGSVWQRWDPHLHAPGTLLNDQFGGNWEAYLERIEKSSPRIVALGVTDYFCIQTYRAVRSQKAEGRLKDVEFIFPNVEMRIETKTADEHAINIHLLFSPADDDHETQIERILGHLEFDYKETRYRCTRDQLVALGKHHDPKQADDVAAMRVGANQFKTNLKDLKGLFKTERWMRDNALVAIASRSGDGTAGLQDDAAFAAMRIELERFADVMFSSRDKDRVFWLGENPKFPLAFIEERYRALKPCLSGSDAHHPEATGEGRLCWLKGDLTFETLRQAVVEPGRRAFIGPQPPSDAIPATTIQEVRFHGSPWMQRETIPLNGGLVAIIGARGSGKTALAELVARGGAAADAGQGEASFLKRASTPSNYLGQSEVEVLWGDGDSVKRRMAPQFLSGDPERVRYLSQHFVERLCSSSGLATELRAAMEDVVFESTDATERLETDSFNELADRLLEPIRTTYSDLQIRIDTIGDVIVQEEILQDRLGALKTQRATLEKKIRSAKKEQEKLIPKGKEERAHVLARLEQACVSLQVKVEAARRRQKTIDDLESAAKYLLESTEPTRFAAMRQKFAGAQLTTEEWNAFRLQFEGNPSEVIAAAGVRAEQAVRSLQEVNPTEPMAHMTLPYEQWPLNPLKAERDKVKASVGIDVQGQNRYEESQKQIALDELSLAKLDVQIEQAAGAAARRDAQIELRRKLYVQVFEQLVKEEAVLGQLYAPLKDRLSGSKGALAKLAFVTERTVDLDSWCHRGEEQFDLRSSNRFRGRGAIQRMAEEHLLAAWKTGSAPDVATAMDRFRSDLQKELKTMPAWVSADERRAWYKAVSAWLYSTDHIKLRYGIEYDGVAIEQLSPGTRGVVLLLLYLAVDLHDQRPLIVDQPEENLDPNSVFNELVPHFREARTRRQVFVVTHNANLVVNTDADQVIIASSTQRSTGALPEIDYRTGSLENPDIRGAVCEILEGGERAFLERERRYRLRWGQNLLEEPEAAPDESEAMQG